MITTQFKARLTTASIAAASAGLSVAIISLSKVLLVITALLILLRRSKPAAGLGDPLRGLWTPKLVVLILFAFAGSLFWTSAPMMEALGAMGKYGKFLVIPALLVLIRTRREAFLVLGAFVAGQAFLLISSWLLFLHVPLAWATSNMAKSSYSVFSSYLDQGIMSAVVAAIFWHLKTLAPSRPLFYAASVMAVLALGAVFILFIGRTGHLVGVVMVSMAVFWALPKRYRLAALLVPPLIFFLAFISFDKVQQRFSGVAKEVSAYSAQPETATSSGVRLSLWKTSVQAIAEKPLLGSGVGSWATEYLRIECANNIQHDKLCTVRNPHQEFLQWGVQLGVGGIFMLLAFIGAAALDFLRMEHAVARAGLSVLAGLIVSCLGNSSLYDAYIGDFFCLSLGVLLAYGFQSRSAGGTEGPDG